MTNQTNKWSEVVYIINYNNEVESMTYGEYVSRYGADETTTPLGVASRMHTRTNKIAEWQVIVSAIGMVAATFDREEDANEYADELEVPCTVEFSERTEYQIYSWGPGGNRPSYTGTSFDNEDAASDEIMEYFEYYAQNKASDAPTYYSSEEEAEGERVKISAESMGIDEEVFLSIEKKQIAVKNRRAEIAVDISNKWLAEQKIVFEKYSSLIEKIEGENYKETEARLSAAMPEKIAGQTFHKIVKHKRK